MTKQPAALALDAAMLRKALDYDPATGLLFWRHRDDVLPRVNKRFTGKPAGCPDGQFGYVSIRLYKRLYQAHRLVWLHVHGEWPPAVLDHVDGNPTNNRIENLRPATRAENNRNRIKRPGFTSQYKGVSWDGKMNRWVAQITLARKTHNLGFHDTEEQAHAAYCEAARRLHGEFARTA
jgi:hypothetical protein